MDPDIYASKGSAFGYNLNSSTKSIANLTPIKFVLRLCGCSQLAGVTTPFPSAAGNLFPDQTLDLYSASNNHFPLARGCVPRIHRFANKAAASKRRSSPPPYNMQANIPPKGRPATISLRWVPIFFETINMATVTSSKPTSDSQYTSVCVR